MRRRSRVLRYQPLLEVPSDCEECEPSAGEDDVDEGAGEGAIPMDVKGPESTYLLFAEPLLNDKGPTIASAIQSIVLYRLYLQSLNVPALRFHSDRAAQLMSRPLVQGLHGQAIRISTSTPGVPQENGAAQCAVKEVKLTTRKILAFSALARPSSQWQPRRLHQCKGLEYYVRYHVWLHPSGPRSWRRSGGM